jgi:hypothetical protein
MEEDLMNQTTPARAEDSVRAVIFGMDGVLVDSSRPVGAPPAA